MLEYPSPMPSFRQGVQGLTCTLVLLSAACAAKTPPALSAEAPPPVAAAAQAPAPAVPKTDPVQELAADPALQRSSTLRLRLLHF